MGLSVKPLEKVGEKESVPTIVFIGKLKRHKLVVTEVNAMGTSVVAYNVPGLRDSVVDGKTGILLNANSPQNLAHVAISLLTDRALLKKYSTDALAFSTQFSWDNTAAAFDKLIRQLA